ncbi:hypothetical protein QTP88_028545 [Uroleucon formosanum]
MSFFNSLWNIKKWFSDKTKFSSLGGSTKRKHEECETTNNKRVCMNDSLVETVKTSNESPSETDGMEITNPESFIVPIRASPPVLIEGSQHARSTMSPVIKINLNESNDDDVDIEIIPSYSLSNPQLLSNRNASTKAIREEISSIRGTEELNLSIESGFSALQNNDTSNNTDKNKSFTAMALKYDVETKLLAVSSSESQMNILKKNLEISLCENRILKKKLLSEYLLRKYNEKVAAALFTFIETMQQTSPDGIFPEKLESIKIEIDKIEPQKKNEIFPDYSEIIAESIAFQMSRSLNDFIVQGKNIRIKDLKTIYISTVFVNDEVIDHYLDMIADRNPTNIHTFSTYFYAKLSSQGYQSVRQWSRNKDIFECKKMFIPVLLDNHWCLIYVNFIEKTIKYYDSLGRKILECSYIIFDYLKQEYENKKNEEFNGSEWQVKYAEDCPQQQNVHDCGVFTCVNAEYLSRDAKLDFVQDDIPKLRNKICYEILNNRLCN